MIDEDELRDRDDVGRRIDDLNQQIVETRNQMIKNANAVGNLAAEIRAIGRLHQKQVRRFTINSVGAYVLFVILAAGGFYLAFQSRLERVEFEKNVLRRQQAAARTKMEQLQRQERKRRQTETVAMSFYQLMKGRQIHRAIKRYPDIAKLPLSKVEAALFESWVNQRRAQLAYTAYAAGMRAISEEGWKKAEVEFHRSLSMVPQPPHAASLFYYLGVAQMKLGNYRDAAEAMEKALELKAEKLVSSQIRYHLGTVYELLGRREKARAAYRAYLKRHPRGSHARLARRKLKGLKR